MLRRRLIVVLSNNAFVHLPNKPGRIAAFKKIVCDRVSGLIVICK